METVVSHHGHLFIYLFIYLRNEIKKLKAKVGNDLLQVIHIPNPSFTGAWGNIFQYA